MTSDTMMIKALGGYVSASPLVQFLLGGPCRLDVDGLRQKALKLEDVRPGVLSSLPLPAASAELTEGNEWEDGWQVGLLTERLFVTGPPDGTFPELHGATRHPARFTRVSTGRSPVEDVAESVAILSRNGFAGPLVVAASAGHYRDRPTAVAAVRGVSGVAAVVPTPALSGGVLVTFQATPDVVQAVRGWEPVLRRTRGGWQFAVNDVPRFRENANGALGVVHTVPEA